MAWNPALEGSRRSGGAITGCVQPPVNCCPLFSSPPHTPGWTVGGHLLLGLKHPHCWLGNNKPILPNDIFLVQRKILSLLGIKIHSYMHACHFFKDIAQVTFQNSAHPIGLYSTPTFNVLCTFNCKVLRWGLKHNVNDILQKRKMFRAAGCLEGVHWKAHKSYCRKSTLTDACLVVKYPRILCCI